MKVSPAATGNGCRAIRHQQHRADTMTLGTRNIAEETPIALTYDNATYAVMLASPLDLEDFALGFSLTEGIIEDATDIADIEPIHRPDGIVLRIWLRTDRRSALEGRKRRMAGPAGCGLCGIESLAEAVRTVPAIVADACFTPANVQAAIAALQPQQSLGRATRAVHAAGFWHPDAGLVAIREDVGRHNALDKLAGALATRHIQAAEGILVLTSRVSVELVQKAARIGAGVLAAISAPTTLALETADAANLTLAAIVRDDGFELFTHPGRIRSNPAA